MPIRKIGLIPMGRMLFAHEGKRHLQVECESLGEISLAYQGTLFLGEIREIFGIM
jgi:hypothetical protein